MYFGVDHVCPFGASWKPGSRELGGNYCGVGEGHLFSQQRQTGLKGCSGACKLDGALGIPGLHKFKSDPLLRTMFLWKATMILIKWPFRILIKIYRFGDVLHLSGFKKFCPDYYLRLKS